MHLDHDNTLTCTHSIAETVGAIASEARRRGADYVRVAWDASEASIAKHTLPIYDSTPAIAVALNEHDPFQNGEHMTLPTWYVVSQLNYALGSEVA